MKKRFQEAFSDKDKVFYWDDLYDRQNFQGDIFRRRMNYAMSWIDSLGLQAGSKILDAGCGAGRPAYEVVKRGYDVFGMDYSFEMLKKANSILNRDGYQNVELCQGDIENLPYQNATFDVIICLGVIAYLPSEKKALEELRRVLKPGGVLIISFINKARFVRLLDFPLILGKLSQKLYTRLFAKKKRQQVEISPRFRTFFITKFWETIELTGFTACEYKTVPYEILTLFGKEVFPQSVAVKLTWFFEKVPSVPMIGSFGGMCIFKAQKI